MGDARMCVRLVACVCLFSALLLAIGCVYTSQRCVATTGAVVEPNRLVLVKPGQTTREELISLLGEPSSVYEKDDVEVLTYKAQRQESSSTVIFLLCSKESNTTDSTEYAFELREGVVRNFTRTER